MVESNGKKFVPPRPDNPEMLERAGLMLAAQKRASAEPLPGSLRNAFGEDSINVGPYAVRKLVASDWVILKKLGSPLYDQMLELRQNPDNPAKIEVSEEQEAEIAYQFICPISEVRKVLELGKEKFREEATRCVMDEMPSEMIRLIVTAAIEQIRRSWSTAVSYAEKLEKEGEMRFFREPEASPLTASDGGSTTSPG